MIFHEFHDIFAWSYTEIPGLDPSIVEHRIDTCLDVVLVLQKKRHIHPSKAPPVKSEIEKLRKACFIYPIAYTTWVSNPIPVNKYEQNGSMYEQNPSKVKSQAFYYSLNSSLIL